MKRQVLINDLGEILATGPHPEDLETGDGGPHYGGFEAKTGQYLHTVEFPDDASPAQIGDMHRTHRVRVEGSNAYLEETSS